MKKSYGILMYRMAEEGPEFLLVHPGGPLYAKKENGVWSIPKGEADGPEEPLLTARREFEEETGCRPEGEFMALKPVLQRGGKQVYCWAVEGDFDPSMLKSNVFAFPWPPRSGKTIDIPEVDRAGWFSLESARLLINERQIPLLEELHNRLTSSQ